LRVHDTTAGHPARPRPHQAPSTALTSCARAFVCVRRGTRTMGPLIASSPHDRAAPRPLPPVGLSGPTCPSPRGPCIPTTCSRAPSRWGSVSRLLVKVVRGACRRCAGAAATRRYGPVAATHPIAHHSYRFTRSSSSLAPQEWRVEHKVRDPLALTAKARGGAGLRDRDGSRGSSTVPGGGGGGGDPFLMALRAAGI
jgi:hypothetical protein